MFNGTTQAYHSNRINPGCTSWGDFSVKAKWTLREIAGSCPVYDFCGTVPGLSATSSGFARSSLSDQDKPDISTALYAAHFPVFEVYRGLLTYDSRIATFGILFQP